MVEQLAVNQLVAGSNPAAGAIASLAQSVERIHGKDEVAGSSPAGSFYVEHGPLVKWLRHRPFTAVTRVRIPYGSPLSNFNYIAGWSSQAARRAHNPEVAGSNPVPATNLFTASTLN